MEQIIIKVDSQDTSSAIKEFVSQFNDAAIEEQSDINDEYYLNTYGINKAEFENHLNIGIAQSILGITKPWDETKQELSSSSIVSPRRTMR